MPTIMPWQYSALTTVKSIKKNPHAQCSYEKKVGRVGTVCAGWIDADFHNAALTYYGEEEHFIIKILINI